MMTRLVPRFPIVLGVALLLVCVALSGCSTRTMKSYIGHNITDVTLDYGQPVNAFDMPDGRRGFQWRLGFKHVAPSYANSRGPVMRYGEMTWISSHTPIYGGQPITGECVYTLFAIWHDAAAGWIVRDMRKPAYMCR